MQALAEQMCAIGRRAYERELVDGTGGNFSVRVDNERVLCTPTMSAKGCLTPADLCVVDLAGKPLSGERSPSSEVRMHLELYAASEAIRAVVHTHPPYATTFAVLHEAVPEGILPEGDVFLGPVPIVGYQTPGTRDMGVALRPYARDHVAALLANHGAVTWGPDLEQAYVLTETLEAVCRVVWQARQVGAVQQIPETERAHLAQLRRQLRGHQ